jgi:hypothetical protein
MKYWKGGSVMHDRKKPRYGLLKPSVDAHTIGIHSVKNLLESCGYEVVLAEGEVSEALERYTDERMRLLVIDWIKTHNLQRVGLSYRLDEEEVVRLMGSLVEEMKRANLFDFQGGPVDFLFFAGLPEACRKIELESRGLVRVFQGGETAAKTLLAMGVPLEQIPSEYSESSRYDQSLLEFGKKIIKKGDYRGKPPPDRSGYEGYGSPQDTLVKRLEYSQKHGTLPLIRAHVGPFSSSLTREESVALFLDWVKTLSLGNQLDILSIGSSQLTQSHFGEDWEGLPNGGGVPINSPDEYAQVWEASRPMLVRTYAGTKNIPELAKMHEETLNMAWHALSLWWFNQLDGRGPNDLYTNLLQHEKTMRWIAQKNKPLEANVPHHFAFRGADDVTFIVSAYLGAKWAKQLGIRHFILQDMLNTPRSTWGIQDLAKSRAMLALVRELEDSGFRIYLQPRAGLDYFRPDLDLAKAQLAAVTALMDDIEPWDDRSPWMIHVVSFSEALHLATPEVIHESIEITRHALSRYRALRKKGDVDDMGKNSEVKRRSQALFTEAKAVIRAIESSLEKPYSAEGFYQIFTAGFLPVPYLWGEAYELQYAKNWMTKPYKGGVVLVNEDLSPMTADNRTAIAGRHLKDAAYALRARIKATSPLT